METDGTDGRTQVTGWPTVQVGLALYPGSILALGLELLRPIPGPRKRLMLEGVVKQNVSKFFLPPKGQHTSFSFVKARHHQGLRHHWHPALHFTHGTLWRTKIFQLLIKDT